jgi:predicted aspartyl protease
MGTFSVQIEIGDSARERWVTMDALVDTGSTMTSVPASLLGDLGVEPESSELFEFAQGEIRALEVGYTWVRVAGKEVMTPVMFNDEGTPALLGAIALESAFMGVDPVRQRLIPVRGLAMRNNH